MMQCVCLGAHARTPATLEALRLLAADCVAVHDVFLLYDDSRGDYDASVVPPGVRSHVFDRDTIAQRYFMTSCDRRGRIYDGNTTFPFLELARAQPGYAFYWRIEYDVRFDGDWCDLLRHFEDDPADLLTTTVQERADRPDWRWWSTFAPPAGVRCAKELRCFMPIARLSARACELLADRYRSAWRGHDEVVVPTLLHHHGLTVADLGGGGSFVRPGDEHRFYTNSPRNRWLAPGTVVCSPSRPTRLARPHVLYHPVK